MADNFKYVQAQNFALYGSGAVAGATSVVLKSFKQIDGTTNLTMTDFGTIGFGTIEPGNGTLEEQISFTGVTQNSNGTATLTGVSTVSMVSPYTATSGLAQTHAGSTTFVISNTSGFYDKLASKLDDETISGTWTFTTPNYPQVDDSTTLPTQQAQLATKAYVDSVVTGGAANATTSVQGLVQLPTQAQVDAGTATGSTGASLTPTPALLRSKLLSDYVIDTGSADAYAIAPSPSISAYATGQMFSFKAIHTNTTTSTLAVNGLTAKTIKKNDGATNLIAGDIVSGQLVIVEYDGTNFQMLSPTGNTYITSASLKFGGDGSDGALSVSSGTTSIDCGAATTLVKNYTSISITGTGAINFTNPASGGTIVILKSQGNVTLTSSTAPMIDCTGIGGAGGAGGAIGLSSSDGADGSAGTTGNGVFDDTNHAGAAGAAAGGAGGLVFTNIASMTRTALQLARRMIIVACGSGGGGGQGGSTTAGSGTCTGGAGGRGGGGLIIECNGAWNFTTALGISVAGTAGTAGADISTSNESVGAAGGGGGGAGGFVVALYNTLTANSGTINTAGSAGGAGGSATTASGGGSTTAINSGGGGGGAGADGGAGGAGAAKVAATNNGSTGSAAGGRRAAGGGGSGGARKGDAGAATNNGGAGGSAGASENVYVAQNIYFT